MMAKQITQQTFDDVVKENMQEFEMTAEEAIEDAVKQFESQEVNLANIIRDVSLYSGADGNDTTVHPVIAAVQKLSQALDGDVPDTASVISDLATVEHECSIDLSHRCLAGSNQAYPTLLKALRKFAADERVISATLQAFCALVNGQPDLLDEEGSSLFIQYLSDFQEKSEVLLLVVRLIRLFCVKHESNRQAFVAKDLIKLLSGLLQSQQSSPDLVKEICFALRVLTFDDDVRVPFGKAHEHAKMIVTEGDALKAILKISEVYSNNVGVLGELFLTLGSLAVRNEFCEEVLSLGGVQLILQAFEKNLSDKAIVRQALVVLRALAGSDKVKVAVVKQRGVELVVASMVKHASNAAIAEGACGVIATLTLRNPDHCTKVMECQGHEAVVQAMKIHPKDAAVQKQACMALRNLVARTREHSTAILELGAEALLNQAASKHKQCEDEAKAALRDLGCAVHLQERWTGQKGALGQ
ncbi:armadillo repeat-containing protein 6-like [Babylonia areolata]|uniref:armadillo repeat-containing protein 6-like n=1 Tax=Babylonia areolata TaxID=304850 RepID=UPI003FD23F54